MYYTGIGSRSTPRDIQLLMDRVARELRDSGYVLRSGGAQGADLAFEVGALPDVEIYLPWPNFNGHPSRFCHPSAEAMALAARFHPAWERCSPAARKLHARNSHQVLGPDLKTPSRFVICWTPGGSGSGGTGQALRIARAYGIPIHDLGDPETLTRFAR